MTDKDACSIMIMYVKYVVDICLFPFLPFCPLMLEHGTVFPT